MACKHACTCLYMFIDMPVYVSAVRIPTLGSLMFVHMSLCMSMHKGVGWSSLCTGMHTRMHVRTNTWMHLRAHTHKHVWQGMVEPLVHLLQHGSNEYKADAARVLVTLSNRSPRVL